MKWIKKGSSSRRIETTTGWSLTLRFRLLMNRQGGAANLLRDERWKRTLADFLYRSRCWAYQRKFSTFTINQYCSLGRPGTFDDSGIMPSWIVTQENKKYLYYIGWNVEVSVPYHLAIGLAVSDDGGQTFQKISQGPILIVPLTSPSSTPHPASCLKATWRMWYVSCTGWEPGRRAT